MVSEAHPEPGFQLAPHGHERPGLILMLAGSFQGSIGGRRLEGEGEGLLVRPRDLLMSASFPTGSHCVILAVADRSRSDQLEAASPLWREPRFLPGRGVTSLARRMLRELRMADTAANLAIEGLALEILAATLRDPEPPGLPPRWLRDMDHHIAEHCQEALTLSQLAREAEVHPVYLARAFRQHFHETVGACVRRHRLRWCADQLLNSDATITQIAQAAGFSDHAHLSRLFKRAYGQAPSRWRKNGR